MKQRSYLKLVNDIINLNIPFNISVIGFVQHDRVYPIIKLEKTDKKTRYHVVIQSGIHGDEAIAIRVLLRWLKSIRPRYLKEFSFTIFPVLNPYGYAHATRRNGKHQMVNSADYWSKSYEIPELNIAGSHYPENANLFIDIHGDCGRYGKTEIYAYERVAPGMPSIAMQALRENNKIIPYIKGDTIYKESCKYGVIYNPKRDRSIQDYMSDIGCECAITLEIPGKMSGINRIDGSVKVINSILKYFLKYKKE